MSNMPCAKQLGRVPICYQSALSQGDCNTSLISSRTRQRPRPAPSENICGTVAFRSGGHRLRRARQTLANQSGWIGIVPRESAWILGHRGRLRSGDPPVEPTDPRQPCSPIRVTLARPRATNGDEIPRRNTGIPRTRWKPPSLSAALRPARSADCAWAWPDNVSGCGPNRCTTRPALRKWVRKPFGQCSAN